MIKAFLVVSLIVASLALPWGFGAGRSVSADTALVAAEDESGLQAVGAEELVGLAAADFSIGKPTVSPAPVSAGAGADIVTRVRSRADRTVTVETVVSDGLGRIAWQWNWTGQTFSRQQGRTYTATWAVPASQPAGAYTARTRLLSSTGAELGASASVSFQIVAGGAAPIEPTATASPTTTSPTATATAVPPTATATATAPAPTATAIVPTATAVPPTATASPTAAAGAYPFRITGSATFVRNITNGLELMRIASPADYEVVATAVTEIREGASNYAWGGRTDIQISANSAGYSATYAGSIVLHEATHVKNWLTNNFPVFGCDGEAKSLRAQADYLYKVGDVAMAQWVEGLIGTWC